MNVFGHERFDSSAFLANCDRLNPNDPTIRAVDAVSHANVVDFDHASWRCGYAHQLGQALLHNNVVNCLWLDPLAFLTKENSNFYSEGAAS
jgi:hypothetical protein